MRPDLVPESPTIPRSGWLEASGATGGSPAGARAGALAGEPPVAPISRDDPAPARSANARPCGYCGAPMAGRGLVGTPRPDRAAAHYCCTGCLSLGERAGHDGSTTPLDPIWIRLAVSLLLVAQSMALGLAINLTPPAGAARLILQGVILGATLVVAALLGGPLARAGRDAIRRRRVTIEALFLTGIAGALDAS